MDTCKKIIAEIMMRGVLLAAGILVGGWGFFLFFHWADTPGDHLFHGEPQSLRNPGDIALSALKGQDQSLIQFGVLLLLLNPLVRVAATFVGYAWDKNIPYLVFSAIILSILGVSFFL